MNGTAARLVRFSAGLLGVVTVGWILTGHAAKPVLQGIPTDWSHRHLIFSQPSTPELAARVEADPRYWQQWARRNMVRVLSTEDESGALPAIPERSAIAQAGKGHGDWAESMGSGASSGADNYPAKYSPQPGVATCGTATLPDYIVFNTGLLGSSTQASIVGYDNLYSGCSGIVPTVFWAFNTGGQVLTSPVISGDGMQVAFVQTNGGFGTLVLLKWAAGGTIGAPVTLTAVSHSAYRTCTAPCMTQIFLQTGLGTQVDDTTSSVFPDFTHDTIWVGGALGYLHKITGVFRGTPTEVLSGGFPALVNTGNALSSPVYDYVSGNVFVGDYGGFLYRVVGSTGAVTKSAQIDHGTGLVAGPIVDSTAGKVYAFSSDDNSTNCVGGTPCAAVYIFTTTFTSGTAGSETAVGSSQVAPPNPNPLYEGDFDSTYEASVNATGNLYVCGNTSGPPVLYQVPITGGVLGTAVPGPVLSNATTTGCSPVTDISNPNATGGTNEWIYAGVQTSGRGNSCGTGGCVMNFSVKQWQPSTAYAIGQEVLDTNFQIQVVRTAGTSRTAAQGHPAWSTTIDASTTDATVRWTDQGPHLASHPAWQASHAYTVNTEIMDINGNVEVVTTAGTSRTAAQGHPNWSTAVNGATTDATVRWRNVGALATASIAAAGGSSGISIDNTVGSGTLAGASQVYFSTQSNQTCGTTGTGGCAVQASQSALQ